MAVNVDQIKELLGNGLASETVAQAVGCTPSYITQLLADDLFAAQVSELRIKNLAANTARDRTIDGIEDSVIHKLSQAVESNMFYKPHDLLRAFQVINSAKRRGVTNNDGAQLTRTTVLNLMLPTKHVNNFTITPQGEVVEAGGQTLTTMTSHELLRKLQASDPTKSNDGRGGKTYKDVERYLAPAADVERTPGR